MMMALKLVNFRRCLCYEKVLLLEVKSVLKCDFSFLKSRKSKCPFPSTQSPHYSEQCLLTQHLAAKDSSPRDFT